MDVDTNNSQNGGRSAVILSGNVNDSDLKNYNEIDGWVFLAVQGPYRAAAEMLTADEAVLVYDGSVPAPVELLDLAVELKVAVVPAGGRNPLDAARRAILARAANPVEADNKAPADDQEPTSARADTRTPEIEKSQADADENPPAPPEDDESDAQQRELPEWKPQNEPSFHSEARPGGQAKARPVRRVRPQQPRLPEMSDVPSPGELISPEELRALLDGHSNPCEPQENDDGR